MKIQSLKWHRGTIKTRHIPFHCSHANAAPLPSEAGFSTVFHSSCAGGTFSEGTSALPATADWADRWAGGLTPLSTVVSEGKEKSATCLMCLHPSLIQWQLQVNWHKSPMFQQLPRSKQAFRFDSRLEALYMFWVVGMLMMLINWVSFCFQMNVMQNGNYVWCGLKKMLMQNHGSSQTTILFHYPEWPS